ncbi:MAG: hypothetical protein LBN27_07750 [Prevotellaceae bacterium]|jgi:hypothetical protein|nr:hypothetical protein [Prevotellaceae bacterium]
MKKKISRFFFNLKRKKLVRRQKKFLNYADIQTVLLLFESNLNEKNPYVNQILKQLEADGKKVTLCGYVDKKMSEQPTLPDFYMLDRSQIGLFGEPKTAFVAPLLERQFDVVLDLTLSDILSLHYIIMYANAPLKVGRKIENCDILDFMIDLKDGEKPMAVGNEDYIAQRVYLLEQIIFYLKSIKSHK